MTTTKDMINEVNLIRKQMGLPVLTESEQLNIEINQLLKEGAWENVKYALSKLGRYKAGGKIFGKSQTDAKAMAQITALLDKKGNEVIKNLDTTLKQKNVEFPNNKNQEDFLNTILEIATVYDSIVAATKLKPNEKGYLPVDAANAIIEDLRVYTQKYLDVDLTAAFSVFNEEITDKDPNDIKVLDYGDPHKTKSGEIDNPMPDGTGFANEAIKNVDGKEVSSKSYRVPGTPIGVERQSDSSLDIARDKVSDKFAGTKAAIKKGDLEAYGSERMKTLKSWRLPAALLGAGASFGALSWLIEYMFPAEKITTMTPETVKDASEQAFGNIKPGEGMTQIMNRLMGSNLTPNSNPNDVVEVLSKLGGGDAQKGVDIITQQGGIFKDPAAAKQTLSAIVSNPTEHGSTLKQVFTGTWAGTGRAAGDTLVTVTGGQLSGMVVKAFTTWITKTTVIQSAKAAIAAPILKGLGVILAAGAVAAALARYKGRKSSRAQILNDLVQYIRPVKGDQDNPTVVGNDGEGNTGNTGNTGDGNNTGKSGNDTQLYNSLKKYFQDIFNFKAQTNTSTYGTGGSGNQPKQYGTGGGRVTTKITQPNDINDIIKLMEEDFKLFEALNKLDVLVEVDKERQYLMNKKVDPNPNDKTLNDIGLSSNELKLFKTHITRLTQLIKVFKNFNSSDKKLQNLINKLKNNPIFSKGIDINTLLKSDPKSLKIFVSDFNKAVYSTNFDKGINIMDKLKKLKINKLDEDAVRTPSKSVANAVYNTRREFLQNFPELIKDFYNVLLHLVMLSKTGKLGQQSGANTQQSGGGSGSNQGSNTSQGANTQQSGGGSGSNQGSNTSQGANTQQSGGGSGSNQGGGKQNSMFWNPDDESTWVRTEDYQLMEMIETHDNLNKIIENVLTEFSENQTEMEQGSVDTVSKGGGRKTDSGRVFTQLSKVVPELSAKIANEYKQTYGQTINRIKLAEFLQTILGALAKVPEAKMVQIISRADMDVTAYRRMLKAIKAPEDGAQGGEQGGEQAKPELPQFNPGNPEKFLPNTVGNYDLSKINQAARIALAQKSAQIISKQTDMTLNSENMVEVMKQLIDDINKSGQKQIPTM
jgi:hypothetical protein